MRKGTLLVVPITIFKTGISSAILILNNNFERHTKWLT